MLDDVFHAIVLQDNTTYSRNICVFYELLDYVNGFGVRLCEKGATVEENADWHIF